MLVLVFKSNYKIIFNIFLVNIGIDGKYIKGSDTRLIQLFCYFLSTLSYLHMQLHIVTNG